ncbi:MAG: hypothetical protein ABL973_04860 [Micropepsaceae bacterium]
MSWLLFLAYLGYTGYQKYLVSGQSTDQAHVTNALLVLSITMIGPFFVSYVMARATQLTGRVPAVLLGFVSAISLSVLGYWVLWKYFSGVSDMRVPVEQALQLGVIPGVIMGVILAVDSMLRRSA